MEMSRQSSGGRPRRAVASFANYRDAERAVDHLSDNKFPVERVSIVGRDLRYVEQVTGRMGYGRAALTGALSGAMVGLLIGWLFAVFNWFNPVVARGWLIIDGLWFGALIGAVMGLVAHALTRGQRDFASIGAMQAERYEVMVDADVADEAARLVQQLETAAPPPEQVEQRPGASGAARPGAT
jgi:hypothetical protein